jgi:hypothetical protein
MIARLRPLALVVLLVLGAFPAVAMAPEPADASMHRSSVAVATITTDAAVVAPVTAPRQVRAGSLWLAAAIALTVLAAVPMVLEGLVGRTRRRIGDVGDEWRCLLIGAPPVVA